MARFPLRSVSGVVAALATSCVLGNYRIGAGLTIAPGTTKIGVLRSATFQATEGDVTWSVQEPEGGTIDERGRYISPATPGTFHVVATSKADPSQRSTATVDVVPLRVVLRGGTVGGSGNIDETTTKAHFRDPLGIAVVSSAAGRVDDPTVMLVADTGNHTIRRYDATKRAVTTVAGTPGAPGLANGRGSAARFHSPTTLVTNIPPTSTPSTEPATKIWIVDYENFCIREMDPETAEVRTLAGQCGVDEHRDSTDGTGASARFRAITSMALGPRGDALYACEVGRDLANGFIGIRRIEVATGKTTSHLSWKVVLDSVTPNPWACVVAANHERMFFVDGRSDRRVKSFEDSATPNPTVTNVALLPDRGPLWFATAMAVGPSDITLVGALQGGLFAPVAILANDSARGEPILHRLSLQFPQAGFNLLAGNVNDPRVVEGDTSGGRFLDPQVLVRDPSGSDRLFVADTRGAAIRSVGFGRVETYVGAADRRERADGNAITGRFSAPYGVTVDLATRDIFVTEPDVDITPYGWPNNTIRKVGAERNLSTFSGVIEPRASTLRNAIDGPSDVARFLAPFDLVSVDKHLYVVDLFAQSVRKVDATTGEVLPFAGQLGATGNADGIGNAARFSLFVNSDEIARFLTAGIASDGTNLYVSDPGNFAIRKIVIATAEVSTLAGGKQGSRDGVGAEARFMAPGGLAYDAGFLYVADTLGHTIRRITLATQEVATLMGAPGEARRLDGAVDTARFSYPFKLVADGLGNLYVAELAIVSNPGLTYRPTGFGMIRRIDLAKKTASVFAGTAGKQGFIEGALPSTLNCPAGLAIDRNGDLVFTDVCDHVVGVIQAE